MTNIAEPDKEIIIPLDDLFTVSLEQDFDYHPLIEGKPSNVFNGRFPYNVLEHKLANITKSDFLATVEFVEELQQRSQMFIDKEKQNIMQSYLQYKEN